MYKILGKDQREYGPIPAEQLREWIREGRANGETMTQVEGADEWRPLSTFPEFDDTLAGKTTPPEPTSPSGSGGASAGARTDVMALAERVRGRTFDVFSCYGRAWDFLWTDPGPLIGVTALVWILILAASSTSIGIALNGPLLGGLYLYLLKKMRGQSAGLELGFAGFGGRVIHLLVASIIYCLLVPIGLALCILPGVYLWLIWMFSFQLIIDKELDFWEAMELSRKTVHAHFMPLLGLSLLGFLLHLLGTLLCGLGIIISIPFATLAGLYAYEDLLRTDESEAA